MDPVKMLKKAGEEKAYALVYARASAILYMLMVPLGFYPFHVIQSLVVSGNGEATANNIVENAATFRISILVALVAQIVNIFLVMTLHRLLKIVHKTAAFMMVLLFVVSVPITMVTVLNEFAVLILLGGPHFFAAFEKKQIFSLMMLFLDLHTHGFFISGLFWGLWLLPMGYLVYKSGFLPKFIGLLLILGGCGYLVDSLLFFVFPTFNFSVVPFTFWGEIIFPLWLLIKGIDVDNYGKPKFT